MTRLKELRQQYSDAGIDEQSVHTNPIQQFTLWFNQARNSGIAEPDGFTLCTVTAQGKPTQRTVLMKSWDEDGFVFYTNHGSRKGQHLADNPNVAMLFPWYALHRQVNIEGTVTRVSEAMSQSYFSSRPEGSQIGAWASRQSEVIKNRSILETKITEVEQKFSGQQIPLPPFWGGYRVKPNRIEFWQGRTHRLHDRLLYERVDNGWTISRLSP